MEIELEKFHRLKKDGYRLTQIKTSVNNSSTFSEVVTMTLKKQDEETVFSSSDPELCSYASHLKSIPHFEDDDSDFVYVKDGNKYFEIEEAVIDLLLGKTKSLLIFENPTNLSDEENQRIVSFEKKWILSEKGFRMLNTKLSQIFYDIGILFRTGRDYEFNILSKNKITFEDVNHLLNESETKELAISFSAFVAGPKVNSNKNEKSDVIIGLIVYDLKNRETISLNLNTLGQFQRKIPNVAQLGLWECIYELFNRTQNGKCFRSFLPLPINLRDYTPLPWFCVAILKGIKEETIINEKKFDMSLFLTFGTPRILKNSLSYEFDSEQQKALIMLDFRDNHQEFLHQVRFDMSAGEPNLHIDYEIFPKKDTKFKCIAHSVVNYKDVWEFSENLAIGFLLASAYDINFEKKVVPRNLDGISEAFENNPVTIIPLFVRSMASEPFKKLKENPELLQAFLKITKKEEVTNKDAINALHNLHLLHEGELTIIGDIVKARILQTDNSEKL